LPEFRREPVTGRWVIVSTDRAKRPRDFTRTQVVVQRKGICPFCPGNENRTPLEILAFRTQGGPNEPGWSTRVIPNKFPALRVEGDFDREPEGLYDRMNGIGAHEVIIDCPEHVASLGETSDANIANVFWAFRERLGDLKNDVRLKYTILFKNHGEAAGASLEHSHSQLIALPIVPKTVQEELDGSRRYFDHHERCVFCDIIRQERRDGKRVVHEDEDVIVFAPYASRFPFEMWILPRRHGSHLEFASAEIYRSLATTLGRLLRKIDRALECPAYNFVLHNGTMKETDSPSYHWHLEIIPRLTRVAGFEWGTGFYINPTTPEEAAGFLRDTIA
jgi:galactose-1-phosphate uridylyltransferase, family 1